MMVSRINPKTLTFSFMITIRLFILSIVSLRVVAQKNNSLERSLKRFQTSEKGFGQQAV